MIASTDLLSMESSVISFGSKNLEAVENFAGSVLASSDWHLYTAGCAIDFGWPNLATIQETLGTIAEQDKDDNVSTKDDLWKGFLSDWQKAKQLAWDHGWDGRCDRNAVFWLPSRESFKYGFVIKTSENGVAFVISPFPLPWLIELDFDYFYHGNKYNFLPSNCCEVRFSDWYEHHEIAKSTAYVLLKETGAILAKKKLPGISQWVGFLEGDQLQIMENAVDKFKRRARISDAVDNKSSSRVSPKLRMDILARDEYTCQICGADRGTGAILEIDHIHPVSRGGTNDPNNLQVLCRDCNAGKSNRIDL
jgi:hypothetical protein